MTNQNRTAQAIQEAERIAAADEYFKARAWLTDTNDNRRIFEAGFDRAYALLSQVRAPVADERTAFDAVSGLEPPCASRRGNHFREGYLEARADALRVLGSLASAPVADEPTKPRPPMCRIAGVSEDVLQRAAARHFKPPFDNCSFRMCDLPGQCRGEGKCHHPASAPVAGEVLFWYRPRSDGWYEGPIHNGRIEEARKRSGAWVPLIAAPHASAENVRNAALEEAAKLMDQTLRSNGAALIRGLKRSQADKDGGQQRAGDGKEPR